MTEHQNIKITVRLYWVIFVTKDSPGRFRLKSSREGYLGELHGRHAICVCNQHSESRAISLLTLAEMQSSASKLLL